MNVRQYYLDSLKSGEQVINRLKTFIFQALIALLCGSFLLGQRSFGQDNTPAFNQLWLKAAGLFEKVKAEAKKIPPDYYCSPEK